MRFEAAILLSVILVPLQAWSQQADVAFGIGRDGARIEGLLQGLDEQERVVVLVGDQRQLIDGEQLAYWGKLSKAGRGAWLLMRGGSQIVADLAGWTEEQVTLESRFWQRTTIQVSSLQAIVLKAPVSISGQDRLLQRIQEHVGEEDVLLLHGGDILRGGLLGTSVMGETLPVIRMRIAGRTDVLKVPVSRVRAVAFRQLPAADQVNSTDRWIVGFRDGSRLSVSSLKQQGTSIRCQLDEDLVLARMPAGGDRPWGDVVYVRPLRESTAYLSDLEPLGYKHVPFLGNSWPYRLDRNVTGGRLACGGAIYEKGIGMHSTSRLAFDVPPEAESFDAEIALDDAAGRRGSVFFVVYCQQQVEGEPAGDWEMVYQSEMVRGGEPPRLLSVPLDGARRLALVVQHADRGDVRDHANWLHARVTLTPAQ
jgi:hypothetical protein